MSATDYAIPPVALAVAAEARGLDAVFLPDQSHVPVDSLWHDGGAVPRHFSHTYDPLVALAACAAATRVIRLGTAVCLVSQRDPHLLARAVASLDILSRGRLVLGAAGGWNRAEMANHGTPFARRWPIVRERILAMKKIWRDAATPGDPSGGVDAGTPWACPRPVQPGGPPVWIGSNSRAVPARVADYADGWMPVRGRYPGDAHADLEAACRERGRDRAELTLALFDAPADEAGARAAVAAGYTELIFVLPASEARVVLPVLDRIAALAARLRAA